MNTNDSILLLTDSVKKEPISDLSFMEDEEYLNSKLFQKYKNKCKTILLDFYKETIGNNILIEQERFHEALFSLGMAHLRQMDGGLQFLQIYGAARIFPITGNMIYPLIKKFLISSVYSDDAVEKTIKLIYGENCQMLHYFEEYRKVVDIDSRFSDVSPNCPYNLMDTFALDMIIDTLNEHKRKSVPEDEFEELTKASVLCDFDLIFSSQCFHFQQQKCILENLSKEQVNILGAPYTKQEISMLLGDIEAEYLYYIFDYIQDSLLSSYIDDECASQKIKSKEKMNLYKKERNSISNELKKAEEKIRLLETQNKGLSEKVNAIISERKEPKPDSDLRKKIHKYEDEIKNLQKQLDEEKRHSQELEEMVNDFESEPQELSKEEREELVQIDEQIFKDRYAFIYEEKKHSNMRRRILNAFPNSIIVSNSNVNINDLNVKAVVFVTKCMSHGFYEGIHSQCLRQNMVYANTLNMNKAAIEIQRVLKKTAEKDE